MTFTPAKPAVIGSKYAPGMRAALRVNKSGIGTFWLVVPSTRFAPLSGDPVGRKFDVRIGRADSHGLVRIEEKDDGAFTFVRGVKGCAILKLAAWDLLPPEAKRGEPVSVHGTDGNAILFKLPPWGCPAPRRLATGVAA